MKAIIMLALFVLSCAGQPSIGASYATLVNNTSTEPLLENIQKKISTAFAQSMMTQSNEKLTKIGNQLEQLYKEKDQNIIQYWRAYIQYYQAIFHISNNNPKESEKAVNEGIELIEKLPSKNSEDYALLGMMQGFNMQFKGMKAMFYTRKVSNSIDAALSSDPENIRAQFVAGSNDFYTPEKYGGGKKVEEHLLKAIDMPAQKTPNPYLPSWGKEEAYEILIRYYIRKKDLAKAKTYYKKGMELFPNSYLINQQASKLIE